MLIYMWLWAGPGWKGSKGEQEGMVVLGESAGPRRADLEEQDSKS